MLLVVAWDDRAEIVSQIKCLGERNKPAVPPKIGRGQRDLVLEQISFCLNRGDSRRFVNERVSRH